MFKLLTSIILCFLLTGLVAQETELKDYRWTTIEADGEAVGRHENGFIEYDGKFYLVGGRGVNPVNVFDPSTNQWETRGKTPMELHHFQAVVHKDAIYVIGAMTGRYPKELPVENIWIYSPAKDEWSKGPLIPEDRRRGSAGVVVYGGKFYMVCGIEYGHTSGTNNYFDCFDPETGEWEILTKAPHVRDHFSAVVADDRLYCIGGRNSSVHREDNFGAFFLATIPEIDVYDFASGTWHTLEDPLPVPTAAGGIVHLGKHLLYMGGEGSRKQAFNETQCLDLETLEWTQLDPLCMGRHGSNALLFEDKVYIAAGSQYRGGGNMNSIEVFSAEHDWQSLFNGKDLSGWEVKCVDEDKHHEFWKAIDGSIVCNSLHSSDHEYFWLLSEAEFGDFELRLKFQSSRLTKGNSGVQFRSRYDKDAAVVPGISGWLDGPQCDLEPNDNWRNGYIYDESRETRRWINPSLPDSRISKEEYAPKRVIFYFEDEESGWNDVRIICRGMHIQTLVNNVLVSDFDASGVLDDESHVRYRVGKSGHFALQLHKKGQNLVRFKDIEVRPL